MTGKIIKGIAGFYYVNNGENKVYQCKAKGIFRNRKIKPLVGDDVEFSVLDEEAMEGNIDEILPRKNQLIRPAAANWWTRHWCFCTDSSGTEFKSFRPLFSDDVHGRYPGNIML